MTMIFFRKTFSIFLITLMAGILSCHIDDDNSNTKLMSNGSYDFNNFNSNRTNTHVDRGDEEGTYYQAENYGSPVGSLYSGYTGTGYVKMGRKAGKSFTIDDIKLTSGQYRLSVRYAMAGKVKQSCSVKVNNNNPGNMIFTSTNSLKNWKEQTIDLTLDYRTNIITFKKVSSGYNLIIDYLYLERIGTTKYYNLIVTNGSGDGKYAKFSDVTIEADEAPNGQFFEKWEVVYGGISIENKYQDIITIVMPGNDVEVKAIYKGDTDDLPQLVFKGIPNGLKTDSQDILNKDMIHPTIIRAKDHIENPLGTYYMYYSPHAHKGISMAYADSLDGPWKQYSSNPVIHSNSAPDIRWISKAGKYYMWVHTNNSHTDLWTTSDGINFKDEGIVAVHCDKIGTKNATYSRVYEHKNKYIMLYSGMNVNANQRSIYIAYSDDAINWEQARTPLVKPAPGENNEIFGPSFLIWGNKNLIVYQDNTGKKGGHLKCVIVNDNFNSVGTGGERHTLLNAPVSSPVNGRFRGAEFYKFSNKLYMFSGASHRFKENIVYATTPF